MNYLLGLASNCDPPDLCLLTSQDYRHESLAPGWDGPLKLCKVRQGCSLNRGITLGKMAPFH
jgi:hypothetical protein